MQSVISRGDFLARISDGAEKGEILNQLAEMNWSILNAIILIREGYGVSLGDAKRVVTSHPAWSGVAENSAPLQKDLEAILAAESSYEGGTE